MELFILGLAVGGLAGSRGKGVVKTLAKTYMVAADKAREMTASMREDMRDAIEEARYEHEQTKAAREEEDLEGDETVFEAVEEVDTETGLANPSQADTAPATPVAATQKDEQETEVRAARRSPRAARAATNHEEPNGAPSAEHSQAPDREAS